MATVSLRGKEKVLAHYTRTNDPFWKLYNSTDKTPLQQHTSGKGVGKSAMSDSSTFLAEILDAIDPSQVYILHTFSVSENGEPQRFVRTSTALCFTLSENTDLPEPDDRGVGKQTQSFDSRPASLKDHIELIKENAKLSMECSLYKSRVEDLQKEVAHLNSLVDELEAELDEIEEEEEEETESVAGTPAPKTYEEAISKLINDHVPVLMENLMSKGIKDPTKQDEISGDNENTEEEEIKVNGVPPTSMPSMEEIVEQLKKKDANFHRHLYKLMLIAQQKPATFSMFINKLENF